MRIKKSRPFALTTTPTPVSQPLRKTLGSFATLGEASDAWQGLREIGDKISPEPLAADVQLRAEEAAKDRAYQSFLNPAAAPGGAAHGPNGSLSASTATAGDDSLNFGATRAITSLGVSADGTDVRGLATPYSAGAKLNQLHPSGEAARVELVQDSAGPSEAQPPRPTPQELSDRDIRRVISFFEARGGPPG